MAAVADLNEEFKIDLVNPESCRLGLWERIEQEGVVLFTRNIWPWPVAAETCIGKKLGGYMQRFGRFSFRLERVLGEAGAL